ncbi:DUF922 domain-containing protein [Winogradskyella ursingii]|uniref:DUF922 domain-containing protein n=1 Tax=Winogradskyella ursingii TaxID=2686079 RepID=UPI0015CC03C9|nr:DUF922 domain-containing protein [Winogradskyella ursingii]
MKILIALLSFFFLVGNPSNEEPMLWTESKKLDWSDFKSAPNPNSDAVALTASGITFGFSIKTTNRNRVVDFTATVESHFYPNKSWYVESMADDYILAHEQLHFDITELYARMFREKLSKLKPNQNIKGQLKRLHNSINEALDKTQKRYDFESNHSMNPEMQKKWELFIELELKKLDNFKV